MLQTTMSVGRSLVEMVAHVSMGKVDLCVCVYLAIRV